ncbi:MAG: protein kinase domain-containing protein [Myxococcota bacterium]
MASVQTIGHGRYRVERPLGTGGMATVFLATDTALGVPRAVKLLRGDEAARSDLRARLRAEARVMARVDHPNVLRIFDVGSEDGRDYVVMEIADESLQDRLDREGPLSPPVAVGYVVQVLAALAAAHAAGVVHRDVKPHNVLLTRGVARLADFGIALLADEDALRTTRAGATMGSLAYMPPEQRLDARSVGPTADVYATGATLYALLTGGNPVDLFAAAPTSPRWRGLAPALVEVIARATRQDPRDRYASARAFALALLAAREGLGGALPVEGRPPATAAPTLADAAQHDAERYLLHEAPEIVDGHATFLESAISDAPHPTLAAPADRRTEVRARRWGAGVAALLLAVAVVVWPRESPAPVEPPTPEAAAPTPSVVATPEAPPAPTQTTLPPPAAPVEDRAPPSRKARKAVAAPSASGTFGSWQGTFGGRSASLKLDGDDAHLAGVVVVRAAGTAVTTRVVGSVDRAARLLVLEDAEAHDDAGTYTLTLGDDGSLDGTWSARGRAQRVAVRFFGGT